MRAFRSLSFFWLFVRFMGVFFVSTSVQAAFTPWNQIVETRLIERVQGQHPPLTSEEKLSLWGAYEKFLTLEYFIQEKHINVTPMPAMGQRTPDQTAYAYLQPYAEVLKRTHAPGFFVLQDFPAMEAYETLLAALYQRDQGNLQQATNAYLKTHWTLEMHRKKASVAVLKEIKRILQLQMGVAAPAFTSSLPSPQASASPHAPWSVMQKKMGRREKASLLATYAQPEGQLDFALFTTREEQKAHIEPILLELIVNETKGIDAAIFRLTNWEIVHALSAAAQRGVPVRMAVDAEAISDVRLEKELRSAGVQLIVDTFPQTGTHRDMHHKFFLFASSGPYKEVVVAGTANASAAGLRGRNIESFTVRNTGDCAKKYRAEFDRLSHMLPQGHASGTASAKSVPRVAARGAVAAPTALADVVSTVAAISEAEMIQLAQQFPDIEDSELKTKMNIGLYKALKSKDMHFLAALEKMNQNVPLTGEEKFHLWSARGKLRSLEIKAEANEDMPIKDEVDFKFLTRTDILAAFRKMEAPGFFSGDSNANVETLLFEMQKLLKKLQNQKEAHLARYQKEYQQAPAAKKAQHVWQIEHTTLEVRSLQESLEMVETLEKQQQKHMPLIGRFEKSPLFKSEAKVASKKPAWGPPAQAAAVVVADQEGIDECWFTSVAADKARIRPALIDYIDNEQGGISAALYRLRERNVINALINLRQQHKKVRILLVLDVDALQPGTQEKLERFGIELFFYQDTEGGLMHDKIYIFQKNTGTKGPVLITGSANSTQAALQGENLESFVIRNKREIVAAYQQQILDVQGLSQAAAEE